MTGLALGAERAAGEVSVNLDQSGEAQVIPERPPGP